ncbi:hypothetical protein C1I99_07095 [Micromonospora deserti]|uniref:Uncharacterized protein n=1 Tax=Micromonospora deserti TaxID=2070366 RepID=A0A2W2DC01_9ACTN|nr:hypothetical protein C1I99_07095 [Micromonospora deserti]
MLTKPELPADLVDMTDDIDQRFSIGDARGFECSPRTVDVYVEAALLQLVVPVASTGVVYDLPVMGVLRR